MEAANRLVPQSLVLTEGARQLLIAEDISARPWRLPGERAWPAPGQRDVLLPAAKADRRAKSAFSAFPPRARSPTSSSSSAPRTWSTRPDRGRCTRRSASTQATGTGSRAHGPRRRTSDPSLAQLVPAGRAQADQVPVVRALLVGASSRSDPRTRSSLRMAAKSFRKAPMQAPMMIVTTPSTTRPAMTWPPNCPAQHAADPREPTGRMGPDTWAIRLVRSSLHNQRTRLIDSGQFS